MAHEAQDTTGKGSLTSEFFMEREGKQKHEN
jgi:hypothetical protein